MSSDEQGNISILALASMTTLMMALMLALEFSCVFAQKLALDNDLNVAREETLSAGFDMQLKNSDEPGVLVSTTIAESLARNGFAEEMEIWFYEASEEEIRQAHPEIGNGKNVRALSYYVSLSKRGSSTIIPASWLEDLHMQSDTAATICPYALYRTYKPPEGAGVLVKYRFKNATMIASSEQSIDSAPAKMRAAIEDSIEKATETAISNT